MQSHFFLICYCGKRKAMGAKNGLELGQRGKGIQKTTWGPTFFGCSVQSLSHVQLFATPWTAAHQASLAITNSWSLLKLMSIESVMPSNHLILCRSLLLQPSNFSNESALHIRWPKYWNFSFSISPSSQVRTIIIHLSQFC